MQFIFVIIFSLFSSINPMDSSEKTIPSLQELCQVSLAKAYTEGDYNQYIKSPNVHPLSLVPIKDKIIFQSIDGSSIAQPIGSFKYTYGHRENFQCDGVEKIIDTLSIVFDEYNDRTLWHAVIRDEKRHVLVENNGHVLFSWTCQPGGIQPFPKCICRNSFIFVEDGNSIKIIDSKNQISSLEGYTIDKILEDDKFILRNCTNKTKALFDAKTRAIEYDNFHDLQTTRERDTYLIRRNTSIFVFYLGKLVFEISNNLLDRYVLSRTGRFLFIQYKGFRPKLIDIEKLYQGKEAEVILDKTFDTNFSNQDLTVRFSLNDDYLLVAFPRKKIGYDFIYKYCVYTINSHKKLNLEFSLASGDGATLSWFKDYLQIHNYGREKLYLIPTHRLDGLPTDLTLEMISQLDGISSFGNALNFWTGDRINNSDMYHPNKKYITTSGRDHVFRLIDIETNAVVMTLPNTQSIHFSEPRGTMFYSTEPNNSRNYTVYKYCNKMTLFECLLGDLIMKNDSAGPLLYDALNDERKGIFWQSLFDWRSIRNSQTMNELDLSFICNTKNCDKEREIKE